MRFDAHWLAARGEGPSSTCPPRPWSQGDLAGGASADCRSALLSKLNPHHPALAGYDIRAHGHTAHVHIEHTRNSQCITSLPLEMCFLAV